MAHAAPYGYTAGSSHHCCLCLSLATWSRRHSLVGSYPLQLFQTPWVLTSIRIQLSILQIWLAWDKETSHLPQIQCYHVTCATRPGVTTQSGVPLSTDDRLLLPESVPIKFGGGDCLFKFSDTYRSLQGSQRTGKACFHQRNTVSLSYPDQTNGDSGTSQQII